MSKKVTEAIAKREKARAAETAKALKAKVPPAPATKPAAAPKATSGT